MENPLYKTTLWQNYLDGAWQQASDGKSMESLNPATGELVAQVPDSSKQDARDAVMIAKKAFRSQDWAFAPEKRAQALYAWSNRLEAASEELAQLLTAEAGKPIREARYEVGRAISYLRYYAGAARTVYGRSTALSSDSYSILAREPVGVVAVIVPWNFPVTLLMRALAPALAAGNTTVIKPAEETTAITLACIRELHATAAFPPGVVNVVSGFGHVVGRQLVEDPHTDMVSFTGGSDTGREVMRVASETVKKVSLELGGKSANIIFDDADLERALPFVISGIFTNAGQLCTVGSRLLVQDTIQARVIDEVKCRAERLRVGNGRDEATQMGPLVSEVQLQRVSGYVDIGKQEAQLITGGNRLTANGLEQGYFFAPTIFDNAPESSPIVQEEIFGPVLAVQPFHDEEEAIALANGTRYGLAAAVWSKNIDRALRASRRLEAGTVWINSYNKLAPEVETGGYKESGIGRASGLEGLYDYTEIKHIYIETEGLRE